MLGKVDANMYLVFKQRQQEGLSKFLSTYNFLSVKIKIKIDKRRILIMYLVTFKDKIIVCMISSLFLNAKGIQKVHLKYFSAWQYIVLKNLLEPSYDI